MTSLMANAAIRGFIGETVEALEKVSRIWPSRYKPETLKQDKDKTAEDGKVTFDSRGKESDSIYALVGPEKSGYKLNFLERMNGLRQARVGFDIEIVVGSMEVTFQAHKIILANSGPFFYSAIYGGLRIVKRLKIPDCDPDMFKIILDYIYTRKYGSDLSFEMALAAINSAKRFGVHEFVDNIQDYFKSNLSYKNVLDLLGSAYLLHMPPPKIGDLEMLCIDIVENQTEKVLSHNMPKLKFSTLCKILRNDNLSISEIDLFQLVYKWSNLECQRRGLELWPENIRQVGNDAFMLLRIPIITLEDIENIILPTNVLTDSEVSALIAWRNSTGGMAASIAGFSRYFRIGGIPGMTDFPPLQYEFGCHKAICNPNDLTDHTHPSSKDDGKYVVISEDPETAITQRKLAQLIDWINEVKVPAGTLAGKLIKFKCLVDKLLKEVTSIELMANNLIVDNELD